MLGPEPPVASRTLRRCAGLTEFALHQTELQLKNLLLPLSSFDILPLLGREQNVGDFPERFFLRRNDGGVFLPWFILGGFLQGALLHTYGKE